jgi:hypothetical protein
MKILLIKRWADSAALALEVSTDSFERDISRRHCPFVGLTNREL